MYARARLSRKEAAGSSPVTSRPTLRLTSSERSTDHSHGAKSPKAAGFKQELQLSGESSSSIC
jgi:hypothetical protein